MVRGVNRDCTPRSLHWRIAVAVCCLLVSLAPSAAVARSESYVVDWNEQQAQPLPLFTTSVDVGPGAASRLWTAVIEYPELQPLEGAGQWPSLQPDSVPEWPVVSTYLGISAKHGVLDVSFMPLLRRDGRVWRIVSFDLKISSSPRYEPSPAAGAEAVAVAASSPGSLSSAMRRSVVAPADRYAAHSVLSQGRWVKMAVKEDAFYSLSNAKLKAMGFKDPSRVSVYGYGGHLLPEKGIEDLPDDLPPVPLYRDANGLVFLGFGPVSRTEAAGGALTHSQNHYATAGCYFLTDAVEPTPSQGADSQQFMQAQWPYHRGFALVEEDAYAFHPSGRKLFESYDYASGASRSYPLDLTGIKTGEKAFVTVAFAHNSGKQTTVTVAADGQTLGTVTIPANGTYCDGALGEATFETTALTPTSRITLTHNRPTGVSGHLDFIRVSYPLATDAHIVAYADRGYTVLGDVPNQDLHATDSVDYVIVVPASGRLDAQAERLAAAHRDRDGLRVQVVRVDAIYNEFSSGTPDATAIRRYLKMLYDRAPAGCEPRYLLLFGDGAWDNRMVSDNWKTTSPDDYLPCFESENSFSATRSFVMEDYYGLLDDGEGGDLLRDKPDIGVGRFPVTTAAQAREAVDKTLAYMDNAHAGAWKNTVLVLGDDGDNNQHMQDAEFVATMLDNTYPEYMLKRIYWDAYPMEVTATGNSYPVVHNRILELLGEGALMVNYSGHGSPDVLSHELVVSKQDMEALTSPRLPLWVTASCDIAPFDNTATSFGEYAFLNPTGGAIALLSTTRTVFSSYNRRINYLFTKALFSRDASGRRLRLGDAVRKAKSDIVSTTEVSLQDYSENKLHYVLLGDPALLIGAADYSLVVDEMASTLRAGEVTTVKGHVENLDGTPNDAFTGTVHPTILDNSEMVVTRNNAGAAEEPFSYEERTKVLYTGSDSVRSGRFAFTFRVPMDINYSGQNGQLNLYAISSDKTAEAQGLTEAFLLGGTMEGLQNDSVGPAITLYLNTPDFINGDRVNETPQLVALLEDADGINIVGNGIGHDLVAIVDGSAQTTYKLNASYQGTFGDYTRGTVVYTLPPLAAGRHTLTLRAWDMMNNSSTATIDFEVVEGLCQRMDVFDLSGRLVWSGTELLTADTQSVVCPLPSGTYLYRVSVGGETSRLRKFLIP